MDLQTTDQQETLSLLYNGESLHQAFSKTASTIFDSAKLVMFERLNLVAQKNYIGLFALDMIMVNRSGQYRRCDVTPQINHQLQIVFQQEVLRKYDLSHPEKKKSYLGQEPWLDIVAGLLHDEGEDIIGLTKNKLEQFLYQFVDNINQYVQLHNKIFNELTLSKPTDKDVENLYSSIPSIISTFDVLTKNYKGEPSLETYQGYLLSILLPTHKNKKISEEKNIIIKAYERAARVKAIDGVANHATIPYRSEKMIYGYVESLAEAQLEYFRQAISQINKIEYMHLNSEFQIASDTKANGFMNATKKVYPNNKKLMRLMQGVLESNSLIYRHDLANTKKYQGAAQPSPVIQAYDNLDLPSSLHLINLLKARLTETGGLDSGVKQYADKKGFFNAPLRQIDPAGSLPIPLEILGYSV